ERVGLDEFAARLDQIAHQLRKYIIGLLAFLHFDLQERAGIGVERRLPQLLRVHLAEPLVTLQRYALAAGRHHNLDQSHRTRDRRLFVLATEHARALIDLLERRRIFVELAGVCRAEQRRVDDRDFLDAAHGALELESLALGEFTLPAALEFFRQDIEAPRDIG